MKLILLVQKQMLSKRECCKKLASNEQYKRSLSILPGYGRPVRDAPTLGLPQLIQHQTNREILKGRGCKKQTMHFLFTVTES